MGKFNDNIVCINALLALLPVEIWRKVLFHVDEYHDFVQLYTSSTFFHSLLQTIRTTLLFQNVFQVLNQREGKPRELLPFKIRLLLRRICWSWKNVVDKFHHNMGTTWPNLFSSLPTFKNAGDIQIFWRYYSNESSAINPFPYRSLTLCLFCPLEELPLYYSQLLELLRKFGHQIWYLGILVNVEDDNLLKHISKILQKIPNLRKVSFANCLPDRLPLQVELSQASLHRSQIPTLKRLVHLSETAMPPMIVQQILKSNPHIRSMKGKFSENMLEILSMVEELRIVIVDKSIWEKFSNARATSPLKYLELDLPFDVIPWNSVLFLLNRHFGKTLQKLTIVAKYLSNSPETIFADHDNDAKYSRVGILDNLKQLGLHTERAVALDFLLPLQQTLENLEVVISDGFSNHPITLNKTALKLHRDQESNIWQLFSNLKCISIERKPFNKTIYNT